MLHKPQENDPFMWTHYCIVDRAWISVGKGEPCNWCGECAGKPEAMVGGKYNGVPVYNDGTIWRIG